MSGNKNSISFSPTFNFQSFKIYSAYSFILICFFLRILQTLVRNEIEFIFKIFSLQQRFIFFISKTPINKKWDKYFEMKHFRYFLFSPSSPVERPLNFPLLCHLQCSKMQMQRQSPSSFKLKLISLLFFPHFYSLKSFPCLSLFVIPLSQWHRQLLGIK